MSASEVWLIIEGFEKENRDSLRAITQTKTPTDPREPETRADAERLGSAVQARIFSQAPAQLNACRTLMVELERLGEEVAHNQDSLAAMKRDVQRELARLIQSNILTGCILATGDNETRVGYFVAAYFFGAAPCDARPWLRLEDSAPGVARLLSFASAEVQRCVEPEVNVAIQGMRLEGCDGIVSQVGLFAPDSTMVHGSVTAAYIPPGPVAGSDKRLGCMKWESEGGNAAIEMGAILNGGAFVHFANPLVRPLDIVVPATTLRRTEGEPLRFVVNWQFDAPSREQGVEVVVNGVRVWRPRYEPRPP